VVTPSRSQKENDRGAPELMASGVEQRRRRREKVSSNRDQKSYRQKKTLATAASVPGVQAGRAAGPRKVACIVTFFARRVQAFRRRKKNRAGDRVTAKRRTGLRLRTACGSVPTLLVRKKRYPGTVPGKEDVGRLPHAQKTRNGLWVYRYDSQKKKASLSFRRGPLRGSCEGEGIFPPGWVGLAALRRRHLAGGSTLDP